MINSSSERQKGITLFVVLSTLMIVIVLANVMLTLMLNHSRLTHHQVGRIQAYYAAMAGVNLAMENLREQVWHYTVTDNSCPAPATPAPGELPNYACQVVDADFTPDPPHNVQRIGIVFCPENTVCFGATTSCTPPPDNDFCIYSIAHYITRQVTPHP